MTHGFTVGHEAAEANGVVVKVKRKTSWKQMSHFFMKSPSFTIVSLDWDEDKSIEVCNTLYPE